MPPGVKLTEFGPAPPDFKKPKFVTELERFLKHPERPMILAICRAEPKKNIESLIKAFGDSKELQAIANLVLVLGTRDKISEMNEEEPKCQVLTNTLVMIDDYNLYDHVAYPKKHTKKDVIDLYRYAATTGGVFVNVAHFEPFGLTILEAAACGVPVIATRNGGPAEIVPILRNGILVDPTETEEISKAAMELLKDKKKWEACSKNGLVGIQKYSWKGHAKKYVKHILQHQRKPPKTPLLNKEYYKPSESTKHLLISDIDNTLIDDRKALRIIQNLVKLKI